MDNGIAIDLGWLALFDRWSAQIEAFRGSFPVEGRSTSSKERMCDAILADKNGHGYSELLIFLEQVVVSDPLVLDGTAAQLLRVSLPAELESVVQMRRPGQAVYERTAENVARLKAQLKGSPTSPAQELRRDMADSGPGNPFWSSAEKNLHDALFRDAALSPVSLAESSDTLERALFYLELGRELREVPLLSTGKRRWLEIIGMQLQKSLHETLVARFDAKVHADHIQAAFADHTLSTPPVAEIVMRKAVMQGVSLWETALEVRESPEAQDYRRLLAELRALLRSGRRGALEAQKCLNTLDGIAELWRRRSDARIGVTRSVRALKFSKLPFIGDLLESVGMSTIEIRDRILDAPPGYLAFISSWYPGK